MDTVTSNVLVTLDGSPAAEAVLPYVRTLSSSLAVAVDLISVIDFTDIARSVSAAEGFFLERLVEDETKTRREYLAAIAQTFPGTDVKLHILKGNAEGAIVEFAARDKTAWIAIASHGRSGLNRWLLGSVAEKVLRGTRNPLLLVRASPKAPSSGQARFRSILVPLDGSPLAETVLPTVADFATKLRLGVVLFRAYQIPYGIYDAGTGATVDLERLVASIENDVQHYLEEKSDTLKKLGIENVTIASKQGFSADEIINYARNTPDDLIAMCSHGRSGIRRWALGSVAETVVRHCANPVLVSRATV